MKLDNPSHLLGDNETSLKDAAEVSATLKKRNLGISYHTCRECEAADITRSYWVSTYEQNADGLTKALNKTCHKGQYVDGGPVFSVHSKG